MFSGDCETSWLRVDVVRLPPAGLAFRGVLAADDEPSLAPESLGESSAFMFMFQHRRASKGTTKYCHSENSCDILQL